MAATGTLSKTSAGRARPWRAALRRHRAGMIVSVGVLALLGAGLVVAAAVLPDCRYSLDSDGFGHCGVVGTGQRLTVLLVQALVGGPVVMGILLGTLVFAREFEQRTHVLALTQQQGRLRWWVVSVATVAGPLFVGWLLLGLGTGWLVDSRSGMFDLFVGRNRMDFPFLEITGGGPALAFLISFSLAATIGVLIRTTALTMVTSLLTAILILVGLLLLRPELVPSERVSTPLGQDVAVEVDTRYPSDGPGVWYRDSGLLDSSGQEIEPDFQYPSCVVADDQFLQGKAIQAHFEQCLRDQGVTAYYNDVVPPDQLNRMRWTVGGIEILLSAAVLGAGVLVLRRRDL